MATISELMGQITGILPKTNNTNTAQNLFNNAEKFADQPEIANRFKGLANLRSGVLNDARENIVNAYNIFEETTNPAFRQLIKTSLTEGDKMLSDIDRQRQEVTSFYGPGGQAEGMIDDYINKYGNLIAQQASNNQSLAKSTGIRSGASQSAVRAGVAQQQALDAENIIKFQEKRVGDLANLYNTYNSLIAGLRQEAAGVNQQFVIQPLAQALDRQTAIAQALVQNEATLNQMRISLSGKGGGTKEPGFTEYMKVYNELSAKKANGMITAEEQKILDGVSKQIAEGTVAGEQVTSDINAILGSGNILTGSVK